MKTSIITLLTFLIINSNFSMAQERLLFSFTEVNAVLKLRERINNINSFLKEKGVKHKPIIFNVGAEIKSYPKLMESMLGKNLEGKKAHYNSWIQDTNDTLKRIEPLRAKAEAIWAKQNAKVNKEYEDGYIYKEKIKTSGIGVILDNSSSMRDQVNKLRKHIIDNFKNAIIRETPECTLTHEKSGNPWFFIKSIPPDVNPFAKIAYPDKLPGQTKLGPDVENLSLIHTLVTFYRVDTIYWFCDLHDHADDPALREVEKLLLNNKVKLYLHIPKRHRNSRKFESIIKKTGGKLIVKKL